MDERLLTGYQALQLLALGPCLLVPFFLAVTAKKPLHIMVPVLFFLSLASSFGLPLLAAFSVSGWAKFMLLAGESLTPSLIFLLMYQLASGRVPPFAYWMILALPLVGGSLLVYADSLSEVGESATCVWGGRICLEPVQIRHLYDVFSSALTLLLALAVFHRIEPVELVSAPLRATTNALVLALIVLDALLLAVELAGVSGAVNVERVDISITVVRIGFVYLILTSVFRVFDRSFSIDFERVPILRPAGPTPREQELSDKIRTLMTEGKAYRAMDISREKLAKQLAVTEHVLSRTVNLCLGHSVSSLINFYRVEEAKAHLAEKDTAITMIAFDVGFSSIPSFNRVFKQLAGVSPTEYRQQQQRGKE